MMHQTYQDNTTRERLIYMFVMMLCACILIAASFIGLGA